MQPKVLFIDWDGTLSSSRFWERWSITASDQSKYRLIQRELFQNSPDLIHEWMCGQTSYTKVLAYIAEQTGIAYKDLLSELRYSCEHMKFIDQSVMDTVQRIRKKHVKVLIATDNMDVFRLWALPALKLYDSFDGIVTSDLQGAMKATLQADGSNVFFNHYLTQHHIKPHESVLIDNSLNNKIVENFGMNFLHVNSTTPLSHHLAQFWNQ